jgi:polyisoprenoid-binding protein YceI
MKTTILFLILFAVGKALSFASEKQIDPERSSITIHVGKTGLLSAAGHEHTVKAPIAGGTIDNGPDARVSFRIEAAELMVLSEPHRDEIQHSMQERVLESSRFPEITFISDKVHSLGDNAWIVSGMLMLHGRVRPVELQVRSVDGKFVGSTEIKQTDFGIQPVSAVGGTVKVKNELKLDFSIATK